MSRAWLLLLLCILPGARADETADPGLARFQTIAVAPVETFVYLGRVALAAAPFQRAGGAFCARYTAKVIPFFFYNEEGTLSIDLADEALRRLVGGATVTFAGTAIREDGRKRLVEGYATATGPDGGTLKVRLHVNRRVVLVFDTTYLLAAAPKPSGTR
jgi:hypothetical protein